LLSHVPVPPTQKQPVPAPQAAKDGLAKVSRGIFQWMIQRQKYFGGDPNAHRVRKVPAGESESAAHALAPIGRHMTAREPTRIDESRRPGDRPSSRG
jgi:hypothetical protein